MASVARFKLDESEAQMVDGLCAEYDPEQYIPQWMRERGSEADWEAWLRLERYELRGSVEVAVLVGSNLDHLAYPWTGEGHLWAREPEVRYQLFYALLDSLTTRADIDDIEGYCRLHAIFSVEESERLSAITAESSRAAYKHALCIDRGPRTVAS